MKSLTSEIKRLKTELEVKIVTLEENIKEIESLKKECWELRNEIAVNDMLHEDFKERMRDKYHYNTGDEESDYEPDETIREKKRAEFRRKKEALKLESTLGCKKCEFVAKSEAGLKNHTLRKHD